MRRVLAVAVLLVLVVSNCTAETAAPQRSAVGFYLDTVITLKAYTEDAGLLNRALQKCGEYEQILSKTIPGSDVWRINHAGGEPVTVSSETMEVLRIAQQVSALSEGAFDITIAPAVALWDFTGGSQIVPEPDQVAEAASHVDYQRLTLQGDTVCLPADMQIDLGGVAKGYIADQIAAYLQEHAVTSALLDFGGNVITIGEKPDGQGPWRVGIQNPDEPRGGYLIAINATDLSVVTSGTYERGFDKDGVRYHHLLDPKTGWPIQNELKSVTIFTGSSALADALSTATFVLGQEKGMLLVESMPDVEAMFITQEGTILATSGATALVVG